MALISCPKCGKQISDKAVKCPHCGVDLTEPFGEYDDSFFELVENVLDALEWDYDVDHEKKCFVSQNLPSYSSIGSIRISVSVIPESGIGDDASNHMYIWGCYESFNYKGPNACTIYELIGRLNADYITPPLLFNEESGFISCTYISLMGSKSMTSDYIKLALICVMKRLQDSGDAIMLVAHGIATPEQAANSAQNDE